MAPRSAASAWLDWHRQPVRQRSRRSEETRVLHPSNAHTLKLIQNPGFWAASLASLLLLAVPQPTQAQIIPDGTLGSQVNGACGGTGGTCDITNGSTRGGNLFHSFQRFSLPNGDVANFQTLPAIQNVIVRVTGQGSGFISDINGTIQTSNPANFFLLNPNGILFGPGATLKIGGSFLATTAERMLFQDGTVLNTRDPTPLLTISVPTGLQMGQQLGAIRMRRTQFNPALGDDFRGIALVGGDITLDDAKIIAPGRQVQLGGIGESSTVGLQLNGSRLSLNTAINTSRRDISLTDGSLIDTRAIMGGGDVIVTGRDIIFSNSSIFSGILAGRGNAVTNQAGDITVDAIARLQLTQGSSITNLVRPNATGRGGNITITAADIQVGRNSIIGTGTLGNGNAGNVWLTANSISIDGGGIVSQVSEPGKGNSGDVFVKTDSLAVLNGATLSTTTFGRGNAGNVFVKANSIALDDSGISSAVANGSHGHSGNVVIDTRSLYLSNGAVVSTNTFGNGDAGRVQITANGIVLDEKSGISSQVERTGIGSSGGIKIHTDSIKVSNSTFISASTRGIGNAGNVQVTANGIILDGGSGISSQIDDKGRGLGGDVTVQANSLTLLNGSVISTNTFGMGDSGDVHVAANTITLDGTNANRSPSSISSQVTSTGQGQGGNVTIGAGSLTLRNSATVSASTFGVGDAGNIDVTAGSIVLDGGTSNTRNGGGIRSQVTLTGQGKGGDINVQADSLSIRNGAAISTASFGIGNAGSVRVTADVISLDGATPDGQASGIGSEVRRTATGEGGNVSISANSLSILNGAGVTSSASGNGDAGGTDVSVHTLQLNRGFITSQSESGNGGDIIINIRDILTIRRNSEISTTAGTDQAGGDGGNITINAPNGFIVGVKSENSDITANAFSGSGGRVNITAQGIYGLQFRPQLTEFSDITASSTFGLSGSVTLNTPDVDPSRGLMELPDNLIETKRILANSCIVRRGETRGTFFITGNGGLPQRPGDPPTPWFPTGDVRSIPDARSSVEQSAVSTATAPMVEIDGIYQLPNGRIILGRQCADE